MFTLALTKEMIEKITKLLVVDDEPQNIEVMREILSFHPEYECKVASSGEQALTILESYIPEIILLDVMMSGIDGYEVCRRIRKKSSHKFSKIIMISGLAMIDDRLKGYEAGADDYLTKPYVEEELIAKLKVYSKLHHMEEVDTLKTTALNIFSHESRTPLNGIIMASELLEEIAGLPDNAKKYISMLHDSGLRLQELVDKINRYFSVKDGLAEKLSLKSLDLAIHNTINNIDHFGPNGTLGLDYNCNSSIKFIADWQLMEEALAYVLENSVKNSKKGDVITINCQQVFTDIIVQVSDQGQKIDPSQTKRMFDGLFLPDLMYHRHGTGLSLAIAKEIIEAHGGKISCCNKEGGGILFELYLKNQYYKNQK